MSGSTKVEISWDKDVVDVADGRLKLHGINYYNPLREGTRYKAPYSVVTKYKMNYVYGYAEIRARVPYEKGAWPSFWGHQIGANGGTNKNGGVAYDEEKSKNAKYGVEVDIFEVFGSLTTLEPTIHRHYNTGVYNYSEIHGTNKNSYSDGSSVSWNWEERGGNIETLSQEYHTYGFLWTKTEYSFYVDGIKYETVDITKSFDECPDYQGFHEPLFLMFNNHVFADDMSYYANEVEDHTTLPFCYYIDWIRVYQKSGVGSQLYIDTTPKTYLGR
jgi:beta-glucanase (GH16 family)